MVEPKDLNYYVDKSENFNLHGLLDIDEFIKKNELKEVKNPIYFDKNKLPTSDGLLSNDIFGITKEERANRFAYIDLHGIFLHPLIYKLWGNLDSRIKNIVFGTNTYSLDASGNLVEDPNGKTGIKFLKDNFDKIKIKTTDSSKRDRIIQFIKKSGKACFITKYPVIPAYYRDVNTEDGKMGVGDINKYYNSLIIAARSLEEAHDYGLTLIHAQVGRMQEILLSIYNYFGAGNPDIKTSGVGMPGKLGVIRRTNMSKTTDYSSRLVISAPELKVEDLDDLDVDMDYSLVPLSSLCVNFLPFMVYWIRRYFEEEFSGKSKYTYTDATGKVVEIPIADYQVVFSDDRIRKELDRFVHGYSNRFVPIEAPVVPGFFKHGEKGYLHFKGRKVPKDYKEGDDFTKYPIQERILTWCDLFFWAAVDVTKGKHILITRYPIDSFYNQFPTRIRVASTVETEPMIVNTFHDKFYKAYPKITQKDILEKADTSNRFKDTLNLCNAYLNSIGGDYDGDQVTVKGIYSNEANDELDKQMKSKVHYISLNGKAVMEVDKETIQALYCFTYIPEDTKLTDPVF